MPRTIPARFSGTCTATGKPYAAGTSITRGPKGWQIVGTSAPARCRCGATITQANCAFCDDCSTDYYRSEYGHRIGPYDR